MRREEIHTKNRKPYPGIAVVGGENISALYGVDNGIVDWQGTGIQHLFYENYEEDLIHSATSFIRFTDGTVEVGNRLVDGKSHPVHQTPSGSENEQGFILSTSFDSQKHSGLSWTEKVMAGERDLILFELNIWNNSDKVQHLEVGCYSIFRNPGGQGIARRDEAHTLVWNGTNQTITVSLEEAEFSHLYVESPTGFVYRTLQQMNRFLPGDGEAITTDTMVGAIAGKKLTLQPKQRKQVKWQLIARNVSAPEKATDRWDTAYEQGKAFWGRWLSKSEVDRLPLNEATKQIFFANLVAIKAAVLQGFVPADITGHYFSYGSPCYYARDAMMIARAFILAGYKDEARAIIRYLEARPTKENGEFFQRYNGKGEPSEGANNNVFHQLDSQGYFLRNILSFGDRFHEKIVPYERVCQATKPLFNNQHKSGLIGPEGGVNEGVFGPAFITSSNMFIYGGLRAAIELAKKEGDEASIKEWSALCEKIDGGIQSTWLEEEGRYGYGVVNYIEDEVVRKYDTPQYFGPLYGYPLTERMEKTNQFLLIHARFFGSGVGYTEQEYHHGPWLFNTGACAQYQALTGNHQEYKKILEWMVEHANAYGLMPEAIDANDESCCFINPLTWACAEFVSTVAIGLTKDGFRPAETKGSGLLEGEVMT